MNLRLVAARRASVRIQGAVRIWMRRSPLVLFIVPGVPSTAYEVGVFWFLFCRLDCGSIIGTRLRRSHEPRH